ncbi:MAG: DUF481 domain-containing protein [Pseudoxanthomonas suwonensis]|nr:DUF481 domain-containing protein [Pseudoxanthomonas suwonensis]
MSAVLTLLILPVFLQPVTEDPSRPVALQVPAEYAPIPMHCRELACTGAGPRLAFAETTPRRDLPGQPRRGQRLRAPTSRNSWVATEFNDSRLGARYGVQAWHDADTQLRVEVGTGLRWRPYADNGSASQGLVARGQVDLQHRLGERTRLSQRTWFETGNNARYLRSAIGLTMQLQPQLSWQTEVELRHHATHGGTEQTRTESRTQLRYRF